LIQFVNLRLRVALFELPVKSATIVIWDSNAATWGGHRLPLPKFSQILVKAYDGVAGCGVKVAHACIGGMARMDGEEYERMGKDRWLKRDGNKVYLVTENEGWAYMNRGAEERQNRVLSVEGNSLNLEGGGSISDSSGGFAREATGYFDAIAKEAEDAAKQLPSKEPETT
jgi:hypothetical protein